jgi:hypothetical protein
MPESWVCAIIVQRFLPYLVENEGSLGWNHRKANWHLLPLYPSILQLADGSSVR